MEKKKKILYVITKSNFGGAQRYVYDLATSLSNEQFDVAVILGGDGKLKEKLNARGIRIITLPNFGRDIHFWNDIKIFFALVRVFQKERPDIIHLNSSKAGGLGSLAARIARVPHIIFTVHGLPSLEPRFTRISFLVAFFSWLSCVLSTATITVSQADFNTIRKWPFLSSKTSLIKNGINLLPTLSKTESRKIIADKIPQLSLAQRVLVGVVAELHENKGLVYLIEAFVTMKNNAILVIVGEGEERKKLEELIQKKNLQDKIFLAGFMPAEKILSAFDIFALPSLKEGLPYVLLEAGAAKLPVVATNVGGIPDIVENQKNGLLVPPCDSGALANSLSQLIKNAALRKKYGENLFEHIKKHFSFKEMFKQTIAVYIEK